MYKMLLPFGWTCLLMVLGVVFTLEIGAGEPFPACVDEGCNFLDCPNPLLNRRQFFIGPEFYHVQRTKEGGTKQTGSMVGVRLGYDRLKRYALYWGGDILYAKGHLKGKSSGGNQIKSHLTDTSLEGRFGYTFQSKCGLYASFTPYIGLGYFRECNKYIHPSPLPVHFNTRFFYGDAGFLSSISLRHNLELGVNFKAKFPIEPKCGVSHDPENDHANQNIKSKVQYRLDLPLTYRLDCNEHFLLSLVPFYEYRHYGQHMNFPFDFIETKFNIYGITCEVMYRL